jgi:methionyl-tRNA formyltransferase
MKILLLGHRDIASNIALSLMVSAMPQHRYVIMLSGHVQAPTSTPRELAELVTFEQRLCDELDGLSHYGILSFDRLAERTGGPLRILAQPNAGDDLALLAELRPDLVISVRYRRILREAAIAIPAHGVLNLHSGLLPRYKGMMATFWAMLAADQTIGSTLHYIVDGTIDTGPIVGRAPIPADRQRSYLANVLALYPAGCRMVIDAVNRIERGEAVARHEQPEAGAYYSSPRREQMLRFQAAGLRLFDGNELQQFMPELEAFDCRSIAAGHA